MILGTAAYMSPEQAKGRVVDRRADVWAFGCVLFEMLTGRRAFDGEDVTDTIAAVVRAEPDWNALPVDAPPQIRLLLKRCLEKDRRARISDIAMARFLMTETLDPPQLNSAAPPAGRRGTLTGIAAGLVLGAVAVAAALWALPHSRHRRASASTVFAHASRCAAAIAQGNDHDIVFSPDGSFIVYRSGDSSLMQPELMIRSLNQLDARPLADTGPARNPFLSPDGRWVGFFVGSELRKVSVLRADRRW